MTVGLVERDVRVVKKGGAGLASPTESEDTHGEWEMSSTVSEAPEESTADSMCSTPPPPSLPVPICFSFDVQQQQADRNQELENERLTFVNDMYKSLCFSPADGKVALRMLLGEASKRDLSTRSSSVSDSEKRKKWRELKQALCAAMDDMGRQAVECKQQLMNYRIFHPDISSEALVIDPVASMSHRREQLQSLREAGKLFL